MRIDATAAPAPSTELAVITDFSGIVPVDFFKKGGSDDILTKLEVEVRAQAAKLDISTETGRKAITSLAYKVARSKKPLEDLRKGLTEDIRKLKEAIDAEGRAADERLENLQKEVRKPLTDWENAEKARLAEHEAALSEISGAATFTADNWQRLGSECIRDRIAEIKRDDRKWEEFAVRAEGVKAIALRSMDTSLGLAERAEEQAAEQERLAAEARERAIKEREEAAARAATAEAERKATEQARLAREAAEAEQRRIENERIEAEARAKQAEAQRIAAEEKAARDLVEAESRRKQQVEQAEKMLIAEQQAAARRAQQAEADAKHAQEQSVEAERKRVADEAERVRLETEKREKNKKHRTAIESAAIDAVESITLMSPEDATAVIRAISEGLIPNVTINY
jgi:hypothetical protein